MPFVLDASVAACWMFEDESHPQADLAFERIRTDEAIVPGIWWFEVRNIFIVKERQKRISDSDTARYLQALSGLPIRVDILPGEAAILKLARRHKLTVYDASYLELAFRQSVPLATLDAELARAAYAEKVPVLGPKQ